MAEEAQEFDLDAALLSVWRQALLERKKRITLGDESYPVQHPIGRSQPATGRLVLGS